MMASPFVRPKKSGFVAALEAALGGIGEAALFKRDPDWRLKLEKERLANEQAAAGIDTERIQQGNLRTAGATAKLANMGKLSDLAAAGMQGYDESTVAPSTGYAMNLPALPGAEPSGQTTVSGGPDFQSEGLPDSPPDFLPPEAASAAGVDLPAPLKAALLNAARGKAAESKLALQRTKADTTAAENFAKHGYRVDEIGATGAQSRLNAAENEQRKRHLAYSSYAQRIGKSIEDLTDQEKVAAIGDFAAKTAPPSKGVTAVMRGGQSVFVPTSQAAGEFAPRTSYDFNGMPSTGGQEGVSLTPPAPVPEAAQSEISGLMQTKDLLDNIRQQAETTQPFGPIAGRIKLAEVDNLGGYGATPDQIRLANTIRTAVVTRAFAMGGKQLTPTEERVLSGMLPTLDDTLEQAMVKLDNQQSILDGIIARRTQLLDPRQRARVSGEGAPTPGGKGGGATHGPAVAKKRSPDGRTMYRDAQGRTWAQ